MLYIVATGSAMVLFYQALVHFGASQSVMALSIAFAFVASIIYGILRDA